MDGSPVSGLGGTTDGSVPRLIGSLPLLTLCGMVVVGEVKAIEFIGLRSKSCSHAVPATLIFRKRIELFVKVPVLSEKM